MKLYKVLNEDGSARYGPGSWPLPVNGEPGDWLRVHGDLVPCRHGLHLCRREDLVHWLGPTIWEAEADDRFKHVVASDKIVVRKARVVRRLDTWNERTARLFAADCAERVLPIFERAVPSDDRPRKAIGAARAFACGEMDAKELAAAREAVWAAAWDAARDAVWDAAWDAAWAAAGTAARAAAGPAVWDAARDAAWDTARAAARAAAWDAARDAERKWQTERLSQYLNGELQ